MGFLEQCTDTEFKDICKAFEVSDQDVKRGLQCLMEWLEKQSHLPNVEDKQLVRMFFLRCKASLERTKTTLEMYYIHKAKMPNVFAKRDPTSALFKKSFNLMVRLPLPKLLANGARAMIIYSEQMEEKDVQSVNSDEILSTALTTLLVSTLMSGAHAGLTIIIDSRNLTPSKVSLLVSIFRKFMLFADLYARVDKIYVINLSGLMESVLLVGRQLSKKLFQERLVILKNGEKDLVKIIPKENLPREYGGTLGSRAELKEACLKEMATWKDWLEEEAKYVADLTKVPADKKQIADMTDFGMDGSFRKLNLE